MNKAVLATLLAVLNSVPAYAADMYAGFKAGQAKYSIPGTIYSPTAIGLFAGYSLNPSLAFEAEYIDLGSITPSKARAKGVSALLFYPGGEPFTLFAKLSYSSSTWKTPSQVIYNSSFTHGLGAQYNATPSASIRLSWDRYMLGNQVAINVDVLSIAGIFKF